MFSSNSIRKKVLVIEDIDSLWLKLYIEQVLLPLNCEIYVLNYKINPKYDDFFRKNGIKYMESKFQHTFISKIPKIGSIFLWISQIKMIKKNNKFDKVVVISVTLRKLTCALHATKNNKDIILYFTGSDILRSSFIHTHFLAQKIRKMKATIVCGSEKIKEECERNIACLQDIKVIYFASDTFDRLAYVRNKYDNKVCRYELHIPQGKITICIGYNAWKSQQHLKVIDAISGLPKEKKKEITILLPMTYCKREKYISKVKEKMKKTKINYILFSEYLNDPQIYMLRIATDIFVNAQTTDSLSGSVMESYCAGSYVLSGNWLRYPDLESQGIVYKYFNDFDDLRSKLNDLLNDKMKIKTNYEYLKANEEKLRVMFSKETFCKEWKKILFE